MEGTRVTDVTGAGSDAAEISRWLAERAIPLSSVEAGQGFDDLQPLKEILRDVRIIGLGESTHGTREFFQMKHRLVEFLVCEMGYSAFLLEASYAACFNIDAYVTRGEGDRAEALASQGFWTWDTEEVSALIDWMHDYNRPLPDEQKVRFLGYDVQRVNQGVDLVRAYLERVAPDLRRTLEPVFQLLWEQNVAKPSDLPADGSLATTQYLTSLYELIGFLSTHRTRLIRETSRAEWQAAIDHARNMFRYYDAYGLSWAGHEDGYEKRDRYMAETIEEILAGMAPDARVIVWAHNAHIATGNILGSAPAMGSYLRKTFGDAYYVLGFTFNEGSFQSRDMREDSDWPLTEFTVGPAPEGFTEALFAQAGLGLSLVDFRGEDAAWLREPRPIRQIGAGYVEDPAQADRFVMHQPLSVYDGMIYVPTTTRARPTPTGIR